MTEGKTSSNHTTPKGESKGKQEYKTQEQRDFPGL